MLGVCPVFPPLEHSSVCLLAPLSACLEASGMNELQSLGEFMASPFPWQSADTLSDNLRAQENTGTPAPAASVQVSVRLAQCMSSVTARRLWETQKLRLRWKREQKCVCVALIQKTGRRSRVDVKAEKKI